MIELPDEKIKLVNLIIKKPITLIGKPGSIIEVNGGSIRIEFESSSNSRNEEGGAVDVSNTMSRILNN